MEYCKECNNRSDSSSHGAPVRSVLGFLLVLATAPTYAATTTTTFTVNAVINAVCLISATNVNFGLYDASLVAPNDTTATLTITCTNLQPYTVALDLGLGAGATFAARKMTSGGHTLTYGLYTDTGRAAVWGDGTGGSNTVPGTGSGIGQNISVFGRIPVGQFEAGGSYADDITATLSY